jgi:hypothetical protein
MFFDLKKDPDENTNVAEDPSYKEVVKELSSSIKKHGEAEVESLNH